MIFYVLYGLRVGSHLVNAVVEHVGHRDVGVAPGLACLRVMEPRTVGNGKLNQDSLWVSRMVPRDFHNTEFLEGLTLPQLVLGCGHINSHPSQ